jgi:pyridinium-3,5-bisthiocarboxylic acid mononucleotide nickel chelatase
MKICYLDAFAGISGDMTLGALVDAGVSAAKLMEALSSLGTGATFQCEKTKRRGISATKFDIHGGEQKKHRHLPHILEMIDRAPLAPEVRANARKVFERLGAAEAQVHDVPIEKVHFHEVGAVDSICDIVGACFGFAELGVEAIHCSPINVGSGTVETEHGTLPVPAPATAALLVGRPVYSRGPATELATPTGAALAATLAPSFGAPPAMCISAIGYGAGSKDFAEHANVLRILVGETSGALESTTVSVIQANIDDASPQLLGYAMERLLAGGALDVTLQPLLMKKNRQATLLTVIAAPEDQEKLAALVLAETTTLGLRIYSAERRVEPRRVVEVETPHGRVRIKVAGESGWAPEYDDCRELARSAGVPLKQVIADAGYAYLKSIR